MSTTVTFTNLLFIIGGLHGDTLFSEREHGKARLLQNFYRQPKPFKAYCKIRSDKPVLIHDKNRGKLPAVFVPLCAQHPALRCLFRPARNLEEVIAKLGLHRSLHGIDICTEDNLVKLLNHLARAKLA